MELRGRGRLDGKVAVVTGAASGIGAAIAHRFASEGASVVLADLQAEEVQARAAALVGDLGDVAVGVGADVSNEDDVAAAVDLATARFGRLDVMVNNAGIVGVVGRIAETPMAAWDQTVAVLLGGVAAGMKHAARVMVPQGSGSIISMASTAGLQSGLGPHCYTACKHAVIGLTKSVSSELGPAGIRVNAIAPGNTVTAMTAAVITGDHTALDQTATAITAASPMGIAGLPEDIADAALYLAGDESRVVNGHTLVVDAGQTADGGSSRFHLRSTAMVREAGRRDPA